MQRAETNIDELLEELSLFFHRLRQSAIDEELFDVISGFEALPKKLNRSAAGAMLSSAATVADGTLRP